MMHPDILSAVARERRADQERALRGRAARRRLREERRARRGGGPDGGTPVERTPVAPEAPQRVPAPRAERVPAGRF
ncbi:hypothetical protein [Nocardiopsis trehalosi]|jgi:hypothetical protein|uniref:hypothetical protein n=1 Tax=Nocardiopsis trehalosi TaxID=109329 RepID=UPI00082C90F0|nr:hypothetical protein [Nocardiopsis trehalosi]